MYDSTSRRQWAHIIQQEEGEILRSEVSVSGTNGSSEDDIDSGVDGLEPGRKEELEIRSAPSSGSSSVPSLLSISAAALSALSVAGATSAGDSQTASGATPTANVTEMGTTHAPKGSGSGVSISMFDMLMGVASFVVVLVLAFCIKGCFRLARLFLGIPGAEPANNPQAGAAQQGQGFPNGRVLVVNRDPGDRHGEIMELHHHEARENLEGEAIPMVVMEAPQEMGGEEEEEDAV
ncbi:hypothetical protein [Candidatus Ichthyocystis sparus]|uniref:hypothetical protein n=1 Tax=Candidatus Ichthyocystis sparus TaxID=1561004 RepID=UPI000B833DA4|nr:hypothetical protein [Candidatus Ichthyocystis sparus]